MQTWVFGGKMGVTSLRVEIALELEWGEAPLQDCGARTPRFVFPGHTNLSTPVGCGQ